MKLEKLKREEVQSMIESILEDFENTIQEEDSEFKSGKLFAYIEVLTNIQRELRGYDIQNLGLNFDVEQLALNKKRVQLDKDSYDF